MTSLEERPPEHADFAATRIGGSRRRPPLVAVLWIVLLVGVVGIGLSGRMSGAGAAATAEPTGAWNVVTEAPLEVPIGSDAAIPIESFPAVVVTSDAGSRLALSIRRGGATIYIHGDVRKPDVTWVYVSVVDQDGVVVGWTSVSVPRGAGGSTAELPALRFDTEVPLPDWSTGQTLLVQAVAHDATGRVVASEQLGVPAEGFRLAPAAPTDACAVGFCRHGGPPPD